jgi:hypothetical protein
VIDIIGGSGFIGTACALKPACGRTRVLVPAEIGPEQ